MTDKNPLFPVLDDGTGFGAVWNAVNEGDATAAENAAPVFAFQDSSGNFVWPTLNSDGTIPVSTQSPGDCKTARGELAAGSVGSAADVTGASITLATSQTYRDIGIVVSATSVSHFSLVHDDDGTPTILWDAMVGPGQYTFGDDLGCLEFTSGATGTQTLKVQVEQLKASCARGTIVALEAA